MNEKAQRRNERIATGNAGLPHGAHISWEPLTINSKHSARPFRLIIMGQQCGCFASLEAAVRKAMA